MSISEIVHSKSRQTATRRSSQKLSRTSQLSLALQAAYFFIYCSLLLPTMGSICSRRSSKVHVEPYFWQTLRNPRRNSMSDADHKDSDVNSPTAAATTANKYREENVHHGYIEYIESMTREQMLEHYQPAEFSLIPVLTSETQPFLASSWKRICESTFDDADINQILPRV